MTQVVELETLSDIFKLPKDDNVYVCWGDDPKPYLAHWTAERDGWEWSHCSMHTVVSREPLTLTASIGWPDKHGWVTDGRWIDA